MLTSVGVQSNLAKYAAVCVLFSVLHYEPLKCSTQLLRDRSLWIKTHSYVIDLQTLGEDKCIKLPPCIHNNKIQKRKRFSMFFFVFCFVFIFRFLISFVASHKPCAVYFNQSEQGHCLLHQSRAKSKPRDLAIATFPHFYSVTCFRFTFTTKLLWSKFYNSKKRSKEKLQREICLPPIL